MSRPQEPAAPDSIAPADRHIRQAEERLTEQEARLRRMIVQGAPTQSAEDLLRQLGATLQAMKEHRRLMRGLRS